MSNSIIRVQKTIDDPFTRISNEVLFDNRLTWEARGLLAYLLAKPDSWTVRMCDLVNNSPKGRDAVRRVLKELETFGYLERKKVRTETGRFTWETVVYEEPVTMDTTLEPEEEEKEEGESKEENFCAKTRDGFPSVGRPSIYKQRKDKQLNLLINPLSAKRAKRNRNSAVNNDRFQGEHAQTISTEQKNQKTGSIAEPPETDQFNNDPATNQIAPKKEFDFKTKKYSWPKGFSFSDYIFERTDQLGYSKYMSPYQFACERESVNAIVTIYPSLTPQKFVNFLEENGEMYIYQNKPDFIDWYNNFGQNY